jgi:hypothetical protein
MKLGADDKKKVVLLGVLGLAALYLVYTNLLAGPETSSSAPVPRPGQQTASIPMAGAQGGSDAAKKRPAAAGRKDAFPPVLRSKRQEERIDPSAVDPTLKLDLLAKVQEIGPAGGTRNLFQMGPPPPKEAETPKGPEPTVFVAQGPKPPPPPPGPKPEPPPPPIPLKFYGFSTIRDNGKKTAYFLDGEDILIAAEGDTVKRRYKVVRIAPTSVLMEDTESKRQQTVPLAEEAQS